MDKSSFNLFKLLLISAIAGTVSTFVMIMLASFDLIDPYEGLISLLDENNIDSSADFTVIGTFFDYWNLVTFALISGNFTNLSEFTITNMLFLLSLSIGCLTISFISSNFLDAIISTTFFFVSLMIISVVLTQFSLVEIPSEDYPPQELEDINQMKTSLLQLTFLIPINKLIQLGLTFAFCVVMTMIFSTILRIQQRRIPKAPPIEL